MRQKIIFWLIAVVFTLFTVVQYNDPDPLLWMMIYGIVAIIPLLKIWMPALNIKAMVTTFLVLFLLYASTYAPYFVEYLQKPNKEELFGSMIYDKPWIEGSREFLGLMIAIGALLYLRKK